MRTARRQPARDGRFARNPLGFQAFVILLERRGGLAIRYRLPSLCSILRLQFGDRVRNLLHCHC